MDSDPLDQKFTRYLIHHIILPPQVPQRIENDKIALEHMLLGFVKQALGEFVKQVASDHASTWNVILRMVDNMFGAEKDGKLEPHQLMKFLGSLGTGGESLGFAPFPILYMSLVPYFIN